MKRILCRIGVHRWVCFGPFDTERRCDRCRKRQSFYIGPLDWFGSWM